MSTQRNRRKSVIAVLGATLGAILLALSAPAVHAAPDDGTDPGPPALHVHASENPVGFAPFETTKPVTLTWNPQPAAVHFYVEDNGGYYLDKTVDKGSTSFDMMVTFGKWYKVWAVNLDGDGPNPNDFLIITTEKAEPLVPPLKPIPIPLPQPPGINTPLIPRLPGLPVR
jgi:hypothetical protein